MMLSIFLEMIGASQIFILLLILAVFSLWVLAIVDIAKSNFKGNEKTMWILIVIFLGLLGALIYYLVGKNQKIKDNEA